MDVVRLCANLPSRNATDFEVGVARALTSSGVTLSRSWLADVDVTTGTRVAVELGFGGSVVCRGVGHVVQVAADGAVQVELTDVDEAWQALSGRVRRSRSGLLVSVPDAFVVDDVAPPPAIQHLDLAHREALLARMLASAGSEDTLEGEGPDTEPSTASGPVRPAGLLLDLVGLDSFPDAPPPPGLEPEAPLLYERQSTDIDLLGEVSASDVIALDGDLSSIDDDALAELPSMEAELLDDDTVPPAALSLVRPLPRPTSDERFAPAVPVVAAGWTVSRRGTPSGLEHFGWPTTGTRRELIHDVAAPDDGDVFSTPATPAVGDPYEARDSDPSLDVEHIVARNTRVADIFADSDDDLFRSSDADVTRDEMPLPRLATPPQFIGGEVAPLPMQTSVFEHDSSDERSAG